MRIKKTRTKKNDIQFNIRRRRKQKINQSYIFISKSTTKKIYLHLRKKEII